MKTKLIMLDTPIIVSDEEIKEGDFCIALKVYSSEKFDKIFQVEKIGDEDSFVLHGTDGWRYSLSYAEKIIAGLPGLPQIDWNNLEEEFGYIDIIKLSENSTKNKTFGTLKYYLYLCNYCLT